MLKRMTKESLYRSAAEHECLSVWIFGSALNSINPRDIDILYVYLPTSKDSWIRAIEFRKYMEGSFLKLFNVQSHVILLTESEEAEIGFITKEYCEKIYP